MKQKSVRLSTSPEFSRVIEAQSVFNFRDFGGYKAKDGARLRTGILYRSGDHSQATEQDQVQTKALGLASWVDLRSHKERSKKPNRLWSDPNIKHISAPSYQTQDAPHMLQPSGVVTADSVRQGLLGAFRTLPFDPPLIEAFRMCIAGLAESSGAALVHCTAGKDRTGMVVALVHYLLGVHQDDIYADFLLTNTAGDREARFQALAPLVREMWGGTVSDEAVQAALDVEAAYLDAFFRELETRANGVSRYASDVLCLSSDTVGKLEQRLFE